MVLKFGVPELVHHTSLAQHLPPQRLSDQHREPYRWTPTQQHDLGEAGQDR